MIAWLVRNNRCRQALGWVCCSAVPVVPGVCSVQLPIVAESTLSLEKRQHRTSGVLVGRKHVWRCHWLRKCGHVNRVSHDASPPCHSRHTGTASIHHPPAVLSLVLEKCLKISQGSLQPLLGKALLALWVAAVRRSASALNCSHAVGIVPLHCSTPNGTRKRSYRWGMRSGY